MRGDEHHDNDDPAVTRSQSSTHTHIHSQQLCQHASCRSRLLCSRTSTPLHTLRCLPSSSLSLVLSSLLCSSLHFFHNTSPLLSRSPSLSSSGLRDPPCDRPHVALVSPHPQHRLLAFTRVKCVSGWRLTLRRESAIRLNSSSSGLLFGTKEAAVHAAVRHDLIFPLLLSLPLSVDQSCDQVPLHQENAREKERDSMAAGAFLICFSFCI